jgi:hypothetical protein
MSHDLLLGRLRRDWSIGGAVPLPDLEPPTRDEQLATAITTKPPQKPGTPSPPNLILSKLREAAPGAMEVYDEWRPTYKNRTVAVRHKI